MSNLDNQVKESLSFLDNEYINAGVSLFLILYTGLVAPKLPKSIADFLDSTLGKFLMFFMIIYISRKDTTIAIIAAVAVIISIMALDRMKLNEHMTNISTINNIKESSENIKEMTDDLSDEVKYLTSEINELTEDKMVEDRMKELASEETMVESEMGPVGVESELTEALSNLDEVRNTIGDVMDESNEELYKEEPLGISEESLDSLGEIEDESLMAQEQVIEEVEQEFEDNSGIEGVSESDDLSSLDEVLQEIDQENEVSVEDEVSEEDELSEEEMEDDDEEVNMEELDDQMINEVLEKKKQAEEKGIKVGPKKLKFYCKCVLKKYKKDLQTASSNLVMN